MNEKDELIRKFINPDIDKIANEAFLIYKKKPKVSIHIFFDLITKEFEAVNIPIQEALEYAEKSKVWLTMIQRTPETIREALHGCTLLMTDDEAIKVGRMSDDVFKFVFSQPDADERILRGIKWRYKYIVYGLVACLQDEVLSKHAIVLNPKENWSIGRMGSADLIVTDYSDGFEAGTGHNDIEYYGGNIICESVYREKDRYLISAAPDMLEALESIKTYDDINLPLFMWDLINASIKKAKGITN